MATRGHLPAGLPVPAHLRSRHTYARLTADFGVGIATVYQYVDEVARPLAALSPSLNEAMETAVARLMAPGSPHPVATTAGCA